MTQFENHGLKGGVWSGILKADTKPARAFLMHHGEIRAFAQLKPAVGGGWQVSVNLPATLLSDGAFSFALAIDNGEGDTAPLPDAIRLDHLQVIAGDVLGDDLTAEIALIRDELEFLKREFRRFALGK